MPDHQTLRGVVSNLRYIEQIGRTVRYTDKPGAASSVTFEVDGHAVTAINNGFPPISEGDDVEVVGAVNPRRHGGGAIAQSYDRRSVAVQRWAHSMAKPLQIKVMILLKSIPGTMKGCPSRRTIRGFANTT